MSNSKVKGLLKGLRYISQIFDNEKEAEMQIGHPTDVKHVAHIGWDGPSVNSPSWMNEFKTPPSISSAPLRLPAPGDIKQDVSTKWASEECNQRGGVQSDSNSTAHNVVDVPKSSSRRPSLSSESPRSSKSERPKAKRSSKPKECCNSDQKQTTRRPADHNDSPDIPRNGRRKKTSAHPSTTMSKSQAPVTYKSPFSDPGSGTGSISISNHTALCQTP